jgi:hypothetical protein
MGSDDIQGIIRHVLTALGGSLVAQGIITQGQLTDAVGALCVLGGVAWSLWNKYQHRQQIAAVAAAVGGQ